MPDERMFELADAGQLRNIPDTGRRKSDRLIADSRSQNFVEQFTDQWLDLGGMNRIAVNPEYYPEFRNELKPHMQQETQAFFNEVLRSDTSALAFLDSDFAMLNQPMAEHYGLDGPRGIEFERVALSTDRPTRRPACLRLPFYSPIQPAKIHTPFCEASGFASDCSTIRQLRHRLTFRTSTSKTATLPACHSKNN